MRKGCLEVTPARFCCHSECGFLLWLHSSVCRFGAVVSVVGAGLSRFSRSSINHGEPAPTKERGLRVLVFPCNDFGAQEPGTNEDIVLFCERSYGVSFELFDTVHAVGSQQHPLYARLTNAVEPTGGVSWNFEKFLVGKNGELWLVLRVVCVLILLS